MSLDCNTPQGRAAIARQHEAELMLVRRFPQFGVISTPDTSAAVIDALIHEKGTLRAVAEIKAREMTLEQFNRFNREWLVTESKLTRGIAIATSLAVPLVGILYLWPERWIFVQRLTNADGSRASQWRMEKTVTQATVNGGQAVRENAFIRVTDPGWQAPEAQSTQAWLTFYAKHDLAPQVA